ncbi:M91 family zinc metallopeptidase [Jiangella alkaliphila]|uniref:Hemolysin-type calcium-binding repeat-containing protein n=1 Tax=Jiangella alkaliphila TaxID=419479 RepID=A0A1H2LB16_9ACTN|nr:M91 family zinc metallopeptidase [Jiangella alkaliphila]SDU78119.1 Hemolysin-type calcium-binding repeat-containing protein [Jiangella alkaliphila]
MTVTLPDVWDLQADTGYLDTARQAWQTLANDFGSEATNQRNREAELRLNWECSMADSYFAHATKVATVLGDASDAYGGIADLLGQLKTDVHDAQDDLDASFARAAAGTKSAVRADGMVSFTPWKEDDDLSHVNTEFDTAQGIVDDAIALVRTRDATLLELGRDLYALAEAWSDAADGTDPGWTIPTATSYDIQTTSLDGTTVISTGDGNDKVVVTVDPNTGETIVNITDAAGNLTTQRIAAGEEVVINTGHGDDEILVPRGTEVHVRFATSAGDDTVMAQGSDGDVEAFGGDGIDTIETGAGDDFISGGRDDDYVDGSTGDDVLAGRLGDDVVYGMDGDDVVIGGDGRDYLEGASGDDRVFGGDHHDTISGGYGDDRIFGGTGNDTVYAGGGDDTVDGELGLDTVYAEAGDSAPGDENVVVVEIPSEEEYLRWLEIEVGGSQEFKDRVLADLHMMASSPTGQKMLERQGEHYDDSGFLGYGKDKVTIAEHPGGNNSASYDGDEYRVELDVNHTSPGYDMGYTEDYDITPPSVFFFHELGHINQYRSGSSDEFDDDEEYSDGTPLIERQNVGLPFDHDDDPNTPEVIDPDYDFDYTENAFRDELGLPNRNQY